MAQSRRAVKFAAIIGWPPGAFQAGIFKHNRRIIDGTGRGVAIGKGSGIDKGFEVGAGLSGCRSAESKLFSKNEEMSSWNLQRQCFKSELQSKTEQEGNGPIDQRATGAMEMKSFFGGFWGHSGLQSSSEVRSGLEIELWPWFHMFLCRSGH